MTNFKVAAQLYSVRQYTQTEEGLRDTLTKVKQMGYNAVQMSGIGAIDKTKAQYVKQMSEDLDLKICVTHTAFNQITDETDWVIEFHKMWNCECVGVGSMPGEFTKSKESLIEFAKLMNKYGKIFADNGLILVYHNHRFEFEKYGDKNGMEILFDYFDPKYVQFELDTFWVQSGGANPVEWVKKVDNRMNIVHFKDMGIVDNEQVITEIGSGNLNWEEIIEACNTTGVTYAAVERDDGATEALESLRISLEYLKKMGCSF